MERINGRFSYLRPRFRVSVIPEMAATEVEAHTGLWLTEALSGHFVLAKASIPDNNNNNKAFI